MAEVSKEASKSCNNPKCQGLAKCSSYQHKIYLIYISNNINVSLQVTDKVILQESNYFLTGASNSGYHF